MAFTQVTVSQDYTLADGTEPSGTVTFTPTAAMANGGVAVPAAPVVARLNSGGAISITLDANTDPATEPSGTAYKVDELINGIPRSYTVRVPHDQGGSVTLSSLAALVAAPPVGVNYLTQTSGDARYLIIDQATGYPTVGGGITVLAIPNAAVVPATDPTGGGVLYIQGGALKYRGSSGTVTTIANA